MKGLQDTARFVKHHQAIASEDSIFALIKFYSDVFKVLLRDG